MIFWATLDVTSASATDANARIAAKTRDFVNLCIATPGLMVLYAEV